MDRASRCKAYGPTLVKAFAAQGMPGAWGLGFARQESDFVPDAQNLEGGDETRGGSYGLCAMSLKTAKAHRPNVTVAELKDPTVNAALAAAECAQWVRAHGLDLSEVASRYNSGKPLSRAPESTRVVYVPNVVRYAQDYAPLAKTMEDSSDG